MPPRKKKIIEPVTEPEYIEEAPLSEAFPEPPQEEDTITFKRSHFYSALTVLAFAAGILVGYVVWGRGSSGNTSQANGQIAEAPVTTPDPYKRYDVPTQGFHSIGPADAPITIVEFSDFECPFCRRWNNETYEPLLTAYPGKIRVVYRNFPLTSIHPDAFAAAEAAMCAGEQDVFWPYHDKLFGSEILGSEVYAQYARDLSLNMTTFDNCVADHKYKDAIQADSNFAIDLGVNSTPTFFINGIIVIGAQPLNVFKQVIDKELAGEIPK